MNMNQSFVLINLDQPRGLRDPVWLGSKSGFSASKFSELGAAGSISRTICESGYRCLHNLL